MEEKLAFRGKENLWAKVVAQAWADEGFKTRLLANPEAVLKENGIEFPADIKVTISEAKEGEINLTLPPKPAFPMAVEHLSARVAAGEFNCLKIW